MAGFILRIVSYPTDFLEIIIEPKHEPKHETKHETKHESRGFGGGLMFLVAYGLQDTYLTGRSEMTFFKQAYRRHTDFSNLRR